MSKVSVDKNKFLHFLDLIALKGEIENKEVVLNFKEKFVEASLVSVKNVTGIRAILNESLGNWGVVGIDDLSILRKFVGNFKDKFDMEIVDSKLSMKSGRVRMKCCLRNPDYVKNTLPTDKFATAINETKGNDFVLSKDDISEIISYFNSIKTETLTLKGKDKVLSVHLESVQNTIDLEIALKDSVKPFTFKLAKFFIEILSLFDGEIFCSCNNASKAMYVKYKKDNCEVEFGIAKWGK